MNYDKNSCIGTISMICWATSKGLLFTGPPRTSRHLLQMNEVQTVQLTTVCPQTVQMFILRQSQLTVNVTAHTANIQISSKNGHNVFLTTSKNTV